MEPFKFTFQMPLLSEEKMLHIATQVQRDKRNELEDEAWESFLVKKQSMDLLYNKRKNHVPVTLQEPQNLSNVKETSQPEVARLGNSSLTIVNCNGTGEHMNNLVNSDSEPHLSPIYEESTNVSDNSILDERCAYDKHIRISLPIPDRPTVENVASTLNLGASRSSHSRVQQSKPEARKKIKISRLNLKRIVNCKSSCSSGTASLNQKMDLHMFNIEHHERINAFWMKMSLSLDKILYLLDKIPLPEDIQDDNRRRKRAAEFSVLFGRNHLYPLGWKIKDLRKEVESGLITFRDMHTTMSKKLVEGHQYASNALTAYVNHMPTSIVLGLPDKLRALLKTIVALCELCRSLQMKAMESDGDGHKIGFDCIEEKCKYLVKRVDRQVEKSVEARQAKLNFLDSPRAKKPSKKSMWSKQSPYAMPLPFTKLYKRPIKKLANAKWGPPRRDPKQQRKPASTTNCTIGTDPTDRNNPPCTANSQRLFADDDKIETMVEHIAEDQCQGQTSTICGRKQTVTDGSVPINTISETLGERVGINTSPCRQKHTEELMTLFGPKQSVKKDKSPRKNKHTKQRAYGVKNAQVIILPESQTPEYQHNDINSNMHESFNGSAEKSGEDVCQDSCSPTDSIETSAIPSSLDRTCDIAGRSQIQTSQDQPIRSRVLQVLNKPRFDRKYQEKSGQTTSGTDNKSYAATLASLGKNKQVLKDCSNAHQVNLSQKVRSTQLNLSNKDVLSVLEYTNNFKDYTKGVPIYGEKLKPWNLIAKLSNQLVDEAVKNMVKEIENEPLLEMMCKLELQ